MKNPSGVTLVQVSEYYSIDIETVREFAEYGLYPTALFDGEMGVADGGLERMKKVISLHRALGINKEGIEAVLELRERITGLEGEVEGLTGEVLRLRRRIGIEDVEALERLGLLIEVDAS